VHVVKQHQSTCCGSHWHVTFVGNYSGLFLCLVQLAVTGVSLLSFAANNVYSSTRPSFTFSHKVSTFGQRAKDQPTLRQAMTSESSSRTPACPKRNFRLLYWNQSGCVSMTVFLFFSAKTYMWLQQQESGTCLDSGYSRGSVIKLLACDTMTVLVRWLMNILMNHDRLRDYREHAVWNCIVCVCFRTSAENNSSPRCYVRTYGPRVSTYLPLSVPKVPHISMLYQMHFSCLYEFVDVLRAGRGGAVSTN